MAAFPQINKDQELISLKTVFDNERVIPLAEKVTPLEKCKILFPI